ncbi:calmodulin-binding protein 60 D-like isoform X2 [Curcuma longa]|uniref:calmodulin-binding protein 60 D-like isoform X2 n=1 Tax=Curcuma longa TaxID=136217 RepID=UPI003D9F7948
MQRQSRYERQASMKREKRVLDEVDGETLCPEPKRAKVPALASVIVEALKMDSLQKMFSSLEPILRRVVSEEVERALARLGPAKIGGRSSPKRIEGPDGRNLQLHLRTRLSLPLFTGGKVEGEQGAAIHVVLLDADSGHVVASGPESSAKLDVVVLEGDFNNEDDDPWTEEDFDSHVVKEREGKRPILTGDLVVSLKEGVGTLGELTFTDNSSWIRSRKFRLGLKIASGFCEGIRIREAKTEAFTVKDHRGELYKKHYPPALNDEVWRLEKIGKDGSFHKRLNKQGIITVEDFLKFVIRDPQKLRKILGSGMSNKMWEILVEHAKTCVLSGKYYVYYSDDSRDVGAIFNNIYEFCGLIADEQFYSAENLNDSQKVFADALVKKAYDNWMHVIEYDGEALLNFTKHKKTIAAGNEVLSASPNHPSNDNQISQANLQASVPLEQPLVDIGATREVPLSGSYNGTEVATYLNNRQTQRVASGSHMQFKSPSLMPQNELIGPARQALDMKNDSVALALAPPQQASMGVQLWNQSIHNSNMGMHDDWSNQRDGRGGMDDFFSEEEIRIRSHELLENDDMQNLLRVFSMGGASASLPEDGYTFTSFMPSPCPNFNFDEERSRSSGKAVVGWLKIKAAMRWGIFVRKKAAERRAAQLVEL